MSAMLWHNSSINIEQNTVRAQLFSTIQFKHNHKKGITQLDLTELHKYIDHIQEFLSKYVCQLVSFSSTTGAVVECISKSFPQPLEVTAVQLSKQHEKNQYNGTKFRHCLRYT